MDGVLQRSSTEHLLRNKYANNHYRPNVTNNQGSTVNNTKASESASTLGSRCIGIQQRRSVHKQRSVQQQMPLITELSNRHHPYEDIIDRNVHRNPNNLGHSWDKRNNKKDCHCDTNRHAVLKEWVQHAGKDTIGICLGLSTDNGVTWSAHCTNACHNRVYMPVSTHTAYATAITGITSDTIPKKSTAYSIKGTTATNKTPPMILVKACTAYKMIRAIGASILVPSFVSST